MKLRARAGARQDDKGEKEGEKKKKKREKEDDGDVATRVVGEVKQTTDRSLLSLYGVHHGVDFQRYSSRRHQGDEGGAMGLEGGKWEEGKRSDARARKRGRAGRSERARGDTY